MVSERMRLSFCRHLRDISPQKFSKIGAENFPESLGTTFVINAPYFFRMCWAAVTPFLSARTLAKFRILGSSFQSALLEQVPATRPRVPKRGPCPRRSAYTPNPPEPGGRGHASGGVRR